MMWPKYPPELDFIYSNTVEKLRKKRKTSRNLVNDRFLLKTINLYFDKDKNRRNKVSNAPLTKERASDLQQRESYATAKEADIVVDNEGDLNALFLKIDQLLA